MFGSALRGPQGAQWQGSAGRAEAVPAAAATAALCEQFSAQTMQTAHFVYNCTVHGSMVATVDSSCHESPSEALGGKGVAERRRTAHGQRRATAQVWWRHAARKQRDQSRQVVMEKTYSACTGTPGLPSALAPAVDIAWAVASHRRHRLWLEEAPARRHLGASAL